MDKGIKLAIDKAGGMRALARAIGISYQSIQSWKKIPADRIIDIEDATGVSRHLLRPDLFEVRKKKH
jgi:DNA-binding transcriptional regulator YdaS (Cro superfamily)